MVELKELTQALMVFGLGVIQPRLLTSDVLLNKLFHLINFKIKLMLATL